MYGVYVYIYIYVHILITPITPAVEPPSRKESYEAETPLANLVATRGDILKKSSMRNIQAMNIYIYIYTCVYIYMHTFIFMYTRPIYSYSMRVLQLTNPSKNIFFFDNTVSKQTKDMSLVYIGDWHVHQSCKAITGNGWIVGGL